MDCRELKECLVPLVVQEHPDFLEGKASLVKALLNVDDLEYLDSREKQGNLGYQVFLVLLVTLVLTDSLGSLGALGLVETKESLGFPGNVVETGCRVHQGNKVQLEILSMDYQALLEPRDSLGTMDARGYLERRDPKETDTRGSQGDLKERKGNQGVLDSLEPQVIMEPQGCLAFLDKMDYLDLKVELESRDQVLSKAPRERKDTLESRVDLAFLGYQDWMVSLVSPVKMVYLASRGLKESLDVDSLDKWVPLVCLDRKGTMGSLDSLAFQEPLGPLE
jgi:hypothetical protein